MTNKIKFWKTVKPFFTDKCKTSNNIILTVKNETLSDNKYYKYYQRLISA